jgi:hypothetical protein
VAVLPQLDEITKVDLGLRENSTETQSAVVALLEFDGFGSWPLYFPNLASLIIASATYRQTGAGGRPIMKTGLGVFRRARKSTIWSRFSENSDEYEETSSINMMRDRSVCTNFISTYHHMLDWGHIVTLQ